MEVDEDMPEPKFCIFCGSTVYVRDEDEDEADEDEFY
jgi:hypothetical protein